MKAIRHQCQCWVYAILAGTQALHTLFTSSQLTEDVREQLSSRVAMYYGVAELTLAEGKAIIERGLGGDATEEVVAQILTITGSIHRQVDMIVQRILDLKSRNRRKLETGEVNLHDLITAAGKKMMIGVW